MARPRQLTRRLILTLTIGMVVLWIAAAGTATGLLRAELEESFDGALRQTAQRLLTLAAEQLHELEEDDERHEIPGFDDGDTGDRLAYQIRRADGEVLLRSRNAPRAGYAAALAPGFADAGGFRIYTEKLRRRSLYIQVAEPLSIRQGSLMEAAASLFLPLAAVIPLAALGIWLAVRSGLAPVKELQREIAGRDALNLSPLKPMDLPAELAPIAAAVGRLFERLRRAFAAERAFASNAAHELRTPIAGSLAQTQLLVGELEGTPQAARARSIEAGLKRLGDLAEKLLQLSRAEAGIAAAAEPIDLLPVLRLVVEDCARREGADGRLALLVEPGAGLMRALDRDAFAIAVRNLIDNALLHGGAAEPVEVRVGTEGSISVRNGGPAVDTGTLKTPFVRGRTTARGSGLGLAIVETIMAQTGGRLELNSPIPGRADGFEAVLHFASTP